MVKQLNISSKNINYYIIYFTKNAQNVLPFLNKIIYLNNIITILQRNEMILVAIKNKYGELFFFYISQLEKQVVRMLYLFNYIHFSTIFPQSKFAIF